MHILIFIIILGLLIFVHELGHFLFAKWRKVKVEEFGFGYPPKAVTLFKKGETEYTVNWIPFGGFVKMLGENQDENDESANDPRSFIAKKPWEQIVILFAGSFFNWLLAWLLIVIVFWIGVSVPIQSAPSYGNLHDIKTEVVFVAEDSPADIVGIEAGDQIISIKSEKAELTEISDENILNFINSQGVNEFTISYDSDGEIISAEIIPKEEIIDNKLAIGIAMAEIGFLELAPHEALLYGLEQTWNLTKAVAVGLWGLLVNILTGNFSNLSDVSGPVGIVRAVGNASAAGLLTLASFVALISINLAILNLLPFPALDGGRILFTVIEWIKGSRIKPKIVNMTNAIGFGILILLMILVTVKDIWNLF